ncbi:importer [Aquipluma nitroreducens]|uniref:Importer n=1 Tax=Aquipluma nitroreducens TaxID=2010828 RepID=A0A5K7S3S3_9BACT|nr:APC family permease [Aquipluma nitroreducens]BBE16149.1 importer [Aquipluma nitroreducens]
MTAANSNSEVKLKRVLSLSDLVIYGIILIQPVAALPLFGHANNISKGHAVTTILVAMVAMIFTAISYGRMANRYPAAGSAYTYVGRSINPYLGFIAGWSMFMDYMFIPILCVIFTSITANHLMPFIPYYFWIFFFVIGFTALNLRGIIVAARANWILMIVMSVVVFYFMAAAIRFVFLKEGLGGLFSSRPFYNPETFSFGAIGPATALAALTYIGFDGLTTLSEEVKNPRRNVLIAAVMTCLITGIWSGAQVYLAQISWPDWTSFTNGLTDDAARNNALDTAIMSVAHRAGGPLLDGLLSAILLVGSVGSGITGQLGAGRLLYGMGRDNVIPKKIFGHLGKKTAVPSYNVLFVGGLALFGALLLNYEECARLINFGAFFAFMGVNIASMREYYFKADVKTAKGFFQDFLPPAIGFVICLIIWLNLPLNTFLIGGGWMLIGTIYLTIRTKGFRKATVMMDFTQA